MQSQRAKTSVELSLEDMGKRDLRALDSHEEVLVAHLLKCQFSLRNGRGHGCARSLASAAYSRNV
jgi:hypothetical protein